MPVTIVKRPLPPPPPPAEYDLVGLTRDHIDLIREWSRMTDNPLATDIYNAIGLATGYASSSIELARKAGGLIPITINDVIVRPYQKGK